MGHYAIKFVSFVKPRRASPEPIGGARALSSRIAQFPLYSTAMFASTDEWRSMVRQGRNASDTPDTAGRHLTRLEAGTLLGPARCFQRQLRETPQIRFWRRSGFRSPRGETRIAGIAPWLVECRRVRESLGLAVESSPRNSPSGSLRRAHARGRGGAQRGTSRSEDNLRSVRRSSSKQIGVHYCRGR